MTLLAGKVLLGESTASSAFFARVSTTLIFDVWLLSIVVVVVSSSSIIPLLRPLLVIEQTRRDFASCSHVNSPWKLVIQSFISHVDEPFENCSGAEKKNKKQSLYCCRLLVKKLVFLFVVIVDVVSFAAVAVAKAEVVYLWCVTLLSS